MKITHDNIQLYYEEHGKGPHTYVFVHGTGGNHQHMQSLVAHFSKHNRVITVDLRGHGHSDKPKTDYRIETFAKDIHHICTHLKATKPILVGFSMGGNIVIELASRYPGFAAAIIILDSAFLYTSPIQAVMLQFLEKFRHENFEACIEQIVDISVIPTDRCRQEIKTTFLNTPHYVWASAFESMIAWDKQAASKLKNCTLPILYIEAANQVVDIAKLKELCPQTVHGKVVCSGHCVTLEVPDQVNAMIERFVQCFVS